MNMKRLAPVAILFVWAASTAPAHAQCDDSAMGRQLQAKWTPKVQAANGICETADAMIGMLQEAKAMIGQCMVGQSRADAIAPLDQKIAEWRQTRGQVCE
jgi:hypothetical protein